MRRRKLKKIGIFAGIAVVIIGLIVLNVIRNRFKYNEPGDIGNTTGNLYNEGLFCEYKDYIYFANPVDDYSLYRMKEDGSDLEKLHSDRVSYIQITNDNIYYIRFNKTSADVVLKGQPYGIFRMSIGDTSSKAVYTGLVQNMCVCGNYIYLQSYDDDNFIQLKRVKVDGKEVKKLSNNDYVPLAVWKDSVYFPETDGGYNLKRIEYGSDTIETVTDGNYYMPSFTDNYMYYIDLDSNMKLTRMNLSTNEKEVISDSKCINYNVSSKDNIIYLQMEESKDNHRLCRMQLDGSNLVTISEGDFCNIHIMKNYTYFYKMTGIGADDKILYRVKNSGNTIQQVKLQAED